MRMLKPAYPWSNLYPAGNREALSQRNADSNSGFSPKWTKIWAPRLDSTHEKFMEPTGETLIFFTDLSSPS